jgi:hypothetical protein
MTFLSQCAADTTIVQMPAATEPSSALVRSRWPRNGASKSSAKRSATVAAAGGTNNSAAVSLVQTAAPMNRPSNRPSRGSMPRNARNPSSSSGGASTALR